MTAVEVSIGVGGLFASDGQTVIRTVLGSCIAVCLFDPVSRVGGMNHYMLPAPSEVLRRQDPTCYGLQAMEVLLASMQKLGACRERLIAKLFGAGHVLNTAESNDSVPRRNIAFIERYVKEEGVHVVARDLGGYLPRSVRFYTQTGRALVKRLGEASVREVAAKERHVVRRGSIPMESDICLFD